MFLDWVARTWEQKESAEALTKYAPAAETLGNTVPEHAEQEPLTAIEPR